MAKVKAKVLCFIDNTLRQEGEVFDYAGPPNGCVELFDHSDGADEQAPAPKLRPGRKPKAEVSATE